MRQTPSTHHLSPEGRSPSPATHRPEPRQLLNSGPPWTAGGVAREARATRTRDLHERRKQRIMILAREPASEMRLQLPAPPDRVRERPLRCWAWASRFLLSILEGAHLPRLGQHDPRGLGATQLSLTFARLISGVDGLDNAQIRNRAVLHSTGASAEKPGKNESIAVSSSATDQFGTPPLVWTCQLTFIQLGCGMRAGWGGPRERSQETNPSLSSDPRSQDLRPRVSGPPPPFALGSHALGRMARDRQLGAP